MLRYINCPLNGSGLLSQLFRDQGIDDWEKAKKFVRELPHAKTTDKVDFQQVIQNKKGTVGSKHGLLKKLAAECRLEGVELMMGLYRMNDANTPGIAPVLHHYRLNYIPDDIPLRQIAPASGLILYDVRFKDSQSD